MTIIAERALFVRLLVQSGKFATPDAEAFADALDASTREPATKADLMELKSEVQLLSQRIGSLEKRIDEKIDANNDKLTVRLGGIGLALAGLLFAALRFTTP